ncbi:hypothetical protein HYPSUDRAFT_215086 [Hypholoma sublateritium FD-334 SS-4]|uniref:F-box domain-containing protein n=1 Tax=Hypholoma sublateritium (strain FD-334 SS-4) TaxID=945553 RepID=A0A0D2MIL0_HYPSF|nr:hypothetical protein HYPSUDRAFT_215086 [Hypholoma sublateritium FD-334 SS-4]
MEPVQAHPAASKLFQNEDLIPIILSFLDPEAFYGNGIWDMEPSTRKDLRSAALACKSFFQPAISLLWRKLDSLMPILKLISSFVTEDDIIYTMGSTTIMPEDQQLLNLYSMHVRYLCLANFDKIIRGHVLHRLSHLTPPLLPNLQSIYIPNLDRSMDYRGHETTDVVVLSLVRTLTTLSISGIDVVKEEDVASYLSILDEKKALLQDVHLGGFLTHDTLTLLNRFSNIKFLDLNLKGVDFGSTVILAWSSLPFLTHLTIHLDSDSDYELELGRNAAGNAPNFQALQRLQFGGLPAEALKFFQSIGISETLSCIALDISSESAPSWAADFAFVQSATLSDCITECARIGTSLTRLDLRVAPANEFTTLSDPILSEKSILALSSGCRKLRHISIIGAILLAANDYTIDRVCANGDWKHLRFLRLPDGVNNMSLSLSSLNTLAINCPDLEDLKMSVDFRKTNHELLDNERNMGLRSPHGLQRLCLGKHKSDAPGVDNVVDITTMEMIIGISRFIEYLFPNLNLETITFASTSPVDQKWWKSVSSLMSVYRTVRQETLSDFRRSESEAMEI